MSRLAIDELWTCLCPSWNATSLIRRPSRLPRSKKPPQCLNNPPSRRIYASQQAQPQWDPNRDLNRRRLEAKSRHFDAVYNPSDNLPAKAYKESLPEWRARQDRKALAEEAEDVDFFKESTGALYSRLKAAATKGEYFKAREVVEFLVREKREKPGLEHYNALILANISSNPGTAWRVHELLAEMQKAGLQFDGTTCHAVLKVLAVHPDHLLRTDVLEYMRSKWISLSEAGEHDVAAGLLREGLFEQALERLQAMSRQQVEVQSWLLDMFVYTLCEAREVDEAYQIMRRRHLGGELNMSRSLWHYFLDKASAADHLDATLLGWKSQVNLEYLNPSSGICLNVLTTASRAGDASLATTVFTHLAKRSEPFKPLHYQLLIDAYLSASPPDVSRALSILTLMPVEKLQPTPWQTRSLFQHLRSSPSLLHDSLAALRALHSADRTVPIAALNVLIEAWVHQRNLPEALKVYKQIHTFVPLNGSPQQTFANIETFNILLRGCRTASPPDDAQASFLVAELLALRIKPTALTYDRLILVFIAAAQHHLASSADAEKGAARAGILLDWSARHFMDMQPLGWMPRFGTVEKLATLLARVRDTRCWDVLQMVEEVGEGGVEGWGEKGKWAWRNAEEAWEGGVERESEVVEEVGGLGSV